MIIAIGNTKGGVGKTNTSVSIAAARAKAGKRVWLVDGDRQATAQKAITLRAESGILPGIACSAYSDGPTLRAQVLQQKDLYDEIIIDVGGRDSTAMRAAMMLADVMLVPFEPGNYEVWAMDDLAELVREANSHRDGLRVYSFLNKAEPKEDSEDNREAAEVVSSYEEFQHLPQKLVKRKSFSHSAGNGLTVSEWRNKSGKRDLMAIAELDALISAVF